MGVSLLSTELLADTVQRLSLAQDLESIMRVVRTVARKLTGADGATFVLREHDMCYYADEDAISPLWKGSRFPMSSCISGWAMLHKKCAVIKDIYADERIPADAYRPTFVKSLVMAPIRRADPIGAIGSYWAHPHAPTEEEVTLLQALADITAVSIDNVYARNTLEEQVAARTRELADSLERQQKLNQVKSTFISMASHELRTPLATIATSVSLAQKYAALGEQEKCDKHFARIQSSTNNLISLLNDFLSIEKLESGSMGINLEHFSLGAFLKEVAEGMESLCKPGQAIVTGCTGIGSVIMDKQLLRNVIVNLLSNAIKYSDDTIEVNAELSTECITISVADKGIGIPLAQRKEVFGKFFRASNAHSIQGTGLGLNIVKQYVDILGGSITFKSMEGKGTTFTISIALHPADETGVERVVKPVAKRINAQRH